MELPDLSAFLPFWGDLTEQQKQNITDNTYPRVFPKGSSLSSFGGECLGLVLVQDGQLRVFATSQNGKEATLYRLFERDICLFSASCVLRDIQFEIQIEAERETTALVVPAAFYDRVLHDSLAMANYTNQLMATRISDVMWTLEQVMFKSMDSRLASLLLEQSNLQQSLTLSITHDAIARDLNTAREVVTRMLGYFQQDSIIGLARGKVEILDIDRLRLLAA